MKITGDRMFEISKSGLANTRMIFEKDKIHMTNYQTPFGEMLVGIHTKEIQVNEGEDHIDVYISYGLDVNHEPLADCQIRVGVRNVG